ncbi:MAG: coenzyme F420 hydrogenase subunit beta [Desulforhopalus sp.]|jgi:coenzyme F420 hydrogenase subunit beta
MPKLKTAEPRILKEVVHKELCCGCGVCAGVCPHKALAMQFNRYGEYNPVLTGICVSCGLCEKVCPSLAGNPNEDGIATELYAQLDNIHHRPETGYYLESYVGHAPDEKMHWNGASGGMATWVLCELLQRGEIDYVITVSPNPHPEKLFKFIVVSSPEDVLACSKSAYYPVETSEVLQHVLCNEGRYAMMGLPCVCKAVRLAQRNNKKLRNRITVLLGLVCGNLPSSFLPDFLMRRVDVDPLDCRRVSFREKESGKPNHVHLFKGFDRKEREMCSVYWHEGYSKAYMYEYFKLNSCNYCEDGFAECSDAAFMDAWVERHKNESNGTSFVLVRDPRINELLKADYTLEPIESIISSQDGPVARTKGNGHKSIYERFKRIEKRIWRFGARRAVSIVQNQKIKGHSVMNLIFFPFNVLGYGFHAIDKFLRMILK